MNKEVIVIADFLEEYRTELAASEELLKQDPKYRRGFLDGFTLIIELLRRGGERNVSK